MPDNTEEYGPFCPRSRPRGPIRVLDDALVDQIAAGEVVERPASVIKELVENALDAGAARIQVEVREGGTNWMAVTDDGCGMTPEDARLAFRRHATSKISQADDLLKVRSFGFRGEALPAIASVSRTRLLTRRADREEAFEMRIESARVILERAAGGPVGTRIEVADLFGSVPARRKFLKRPATEWGHIADWLSRFALIWPRVHFEVRRDDRPALVWPATSGRLERIAAVLSDQAAAALLYASGEASAGVLHAFTSSPEHTRPNANGIFLYVNDRPVRDRMLRHALLEVYRDWLPRGRFPTAILFLEVPGGAVDVNVHPAKWEVRFSDPQAIHQLVRRTLRGAIGQRRWLAGAPPPTGVPAPPGTAERPATSEPDATDWMFAPRSRGLASAPSAPSAPEVLEPGRVRFSQERLLGQLLASYLLLEGKGGLLLVDQHAAHERVLYERLRAQWLANGVESQGLLTPLSVELEPAAAAALQDARARAERLGFRVEAFGEDAVIVRGIPALLSGREPAALVREFAEELERAGPEDEAGGAEVRMLDAADRLFAQLACHAARRAGDHLAGSEQRALLDGLDAVPWAPTCPHGRPVAIALDLAEIERRFGRR